MLASNKQKTLQQDESDSQSLKNFGLGGCGGERWVDAGDVLSSIEIGDPPKKNS